MKKPAIAVVSVIVAVALASAITTSRSQAQNASAETWIDDAWILDQLELCRTSPADCGWEAAEAYYWVQAPFEAASPGGRTLLAQHITASALFAGVDRTTIERVANRLERATRDFHPASSCRYDASLDEYDGCPDHADDWIAGWLERRHARGHLTRSEILRLIGVVRATL